MKELTDGEWMFFVSVYYPLFFCSHHTLSGESEMHAQVFPIIPGGTDGKWSWLNIKTTVAYGDVIKDDKN